MSYTNNDEQAVRALIQRWCDAACSGDLDAVMALYTSDVVAFDAIGPLCVRGDREYRRHWEMCLSFVPPGGQMVMEPQEVTVSLGGDFALAYYLARCGCTDEKGELQVGWMRASVGCRRTSSGWRIAHEHYSMPLDPETMMVADDLEP